MQKEKKNILQSVQEGKMTAEEALAILTELEQAEKESEQKEEKLKSELSTTVIEDKTKKEGKDHFDDFFKKNLQSSKEKILDFVESAFQKIKETDLDFNFGKAVEVSHIFQHDQTPLSKIDVDIVNGKTKIIAWDAEDVRVECVAKVYRVEGQDQAREAFLKEMLFKIEEEKLKVYVQEKGIKVDTVIYVPKKRYEDVQIRLFNGSMTAEALETEKLKVKLANGALTIEGVQGGSCELETGNGMIVIQTSDVHTLEAETLNGAIQVGGHFHQMDLKTFNGKIVCRNEKPDSDFLYAKSVTGKIQLSLAAGTAVSGELKSNLGSFNVMVDGIQIVEEKNDVILKVLKFQTVRDQAPVTQLMAETKTGAISIS